MNTNKIAVSRILASVSCSEKSGDGSIMLRNQGALPWAPAESRLLGAFSLHIRDIHGHNCTPLWKNIQSSISVGNHSSIYNQTWLVKFILLGTVRMWTAYQGDEWGLCTHLPLKRGRIPGEVWSPSACLRPSCSRWLGVLPCPPRVHMSLHCDRKMETPWPKYIILSHGQHWKWLYTFLFHKRFKYTGPYIAQGAWNSENYENNFSPPLRIFHLYKVENTKY